MASDPVTTSDRTQLRCEIAALDTGQLWMVLMSLVGTAPDEVRHALDVEQQTRPRAEGDAYVAALIAGQADR